MTLPKYDPENPNPYPARIYSMDEVAKMGFDVEPKGDPGPEDEGLGKESFKDRKWIAPGTFTSQCVIDGGPVSFATDTAIGHTADGKPVYGVRAPVKAKNKTIFAELDPEKHLAYRKLALELGMTNSELISHLLKIHAAYVELVRASHPELNETGPAKMPIKGLARQIFDTMAAAHAGLALKEGFDLAEIEPFDRIKDAFDSEIPYSMQLSQEDHVKVLVAFDRYTVALHKKHVEMLATKDRDG